MIKWLDRAIRYRRQHGKDILLLMFEEFLISLLDACDLRYRPMHLLPLLFTTMVDLFPLLFAQRIVDLPGNLELEVDGNVRTTRWIDRIGGGVIILRWHVRKLLFFPPLDNQLPKTGFPGVGAISLDRSKLSLLALIKP